MEQRFTWASALIPVPGWPCSQRIVLQRVPVPASGSSSAPASPPGSTLRPLTPLVSQYTDEASKEKRCKTLVALSEVVKAHPPERTPTEAPEAGPSKATCILFKLSPALTGFSPKETEETSPDVQDRSLSKAALASTAAPGPGSPQAALAVTAARERKGRPSKGEKRKWEGQRF
ncbi:Hypothetical predicted protein [Xyrichtys novacula]|uniref:Uncharacterized protein n=1 Tax=Xyrichtys novacula TaxID=13765 RepID=A0AAV1GK69_XYRNO|nr:Hypothetical predicted protein [Xyrichtys novacula]